MGGRDLRKNKSTHPTVKITDVMVSQVMCASPQQTVGSVQETMSTHGIHCMPVVDGDGTPLGIVTATDLLREPGEQARIRDVMTKKVFTVPRYSDPALAARVMRNHRIHHVVVTDEKKVVGILSSFDLLRLVEDHRFVMKNATTTRKKGQGSRKKAEQRPEQSPTE